MRIIHLNEIIPEKLYQRGQFVTFPWQTKMRMLEQFDIDFVVNLWARPDPELHTKPGLIYLHWPIGGAQEPENSDLFIQFLTNHIENGNKMLVHCEAGVNRSVWLAARIVAAYHCISGLEALEMVNERIKHIKMRSGLVKDLERIDHS